MLLNTGCSGQLLLFCFVFFTEKQIVKLLCKTHCDTNRLSVLTSLYSVQFRSYLNPYSFFRFSFIVLLMMLCDADVHEPLKLKPGLPVTSYVWPRPPKSHNQIKSRLAAVSVPGGATEQLWMLAGMMWAHGPGAQSMDPFHQEARLKASHWTSVTVQCMWFSLTDVWERVSMNEMTEWKSASLLCTLRDWRHLLWYTICDGHLLGTKDPQHCGEKNINSKLGRDGALKVTSNKVVIQYFL